MKILVFNGAFGVKKALKIIIDSAKEHSVSKIICLGDLIGMGSNNLECFEIARNNEIQVISGRFEAIAGNQIEINNLSDKVINIIEDFRNNLSKEDLIWLSELSRLTIIENLLFMYGDYINRYALFNREKDFKETSIITRKKHPFLNGLIIGSSNQQLFYNGKRLIQVRTKREYEYSGDTIKEDKIIATPGRLYSTLKGGILKASWIIIDTDKKIIQFNSTKVENDDKLNNYEIENFFSA